MAVSGIIFKIKRDIGRKTLIFHIAFHLTCTIIFPLYFFPKILIQTAQFPAVSIFISVCTLFVWLRSDNLIRRDDDDDDDDAGKKMKY